MSWSKRKQKPPKGPKPDLYMEIVLRNAMLRAWTAVGVPVKAEWVGFHDFGNCVELRLSCAECGAKGVNSATVLSVYSRPYVRGLLASRESETALALYRKGCWHLRLMTGDGPVRREAKRIAKLEFLAGGAP